MVRILQVVTYMGRGGLETMLMNYYRHMDRTQVQFDFLVHRQERAAYDNEIESLGGIIYRLPVMNPFSMAYRNALNRFFVDHPEYQVIHVHQDCMSAVILKAAKKHGVPVRIAHSHSKSQDKNIKYLIKIIYRHFIPRYATKMFSCGEDAGKWMFCGAPFEIMNNAIETQQYVSSTEKRQAIRQQLSLSVDDMVIGHVGRFSYPKNHRGLIDVFHEIQKRSRAKLLLVGDGELRAEIEEKVAHLGLTDKVLFMGVRNDVAELLQAMDVFVFPSNYEGLPVTVIEAQAAGLPCLISDHVPIECKKTDLVQQIPLSAGAKAWADAAISAAQSTKRRDTSAEIRAAGYDIVENAKRLQEFYLRAAAGEKNLCLY